MGYSTEFRGSFTLSEPLTVAQKRYLESFAETRRMKRNAEILENLPDPVRVAAKLPVGPEGAYYVGSTADFGQLQTPDIINFNSPPSGQPGLWCCWVPTEDGQGIKWNGAEKFYYYTEWIEYIIENFLKPWGLVLNGEVEWQGESSDDIGKLIVKNNKVTTKHGRIVYS